MEEILSNLYDMTAFSGMSWQVVLMWVIAFILLYLGIKKEYEPLLLVPIAFGLLLANFPGGGMGIVPA
ncbi:MAG: sodium ion-translocating decarboxylase subunit beta, partial [Bacteroidales bacterium]|nr:sodium ion-translocating decarboxylase subunit beta [Bacteroidales bacterium]